MKYTSILLLACAGGLLACQPKSGVPTSSSTAASGPVATVNGKSISRDFFDFYVKGVAGKSASELSADQRQQVLDNLIRAAIVAQQAEKDGIPNDKDTAMVLELSRLNVLHQAVSERYLKSRSPTEQELRAEYETQVAALPRLEYRARHILVATEAFAHKLIEKLEKGANFAELAQRESMDGSKSNGGDLGWFTPERMVKPFSDAVLALKPGEFTRAPVQTQYGWHVIRLEETRDLAAPPFDSVRERLEQVVQAKKFQTYTDELIKNAKIEKKL